MALVLKRILIVDDHKQLRKLIRSYFEGEEGLYICSEAVDGLDALEKCEGLKPDLIILDLSMPRINGIEAAPRLKKLLPCTPIILFTSHQHALRNFDTKAVGIDAVISKNENMSVLAKKVTNLLQRGSSTHASV